MATVQGSCLCGDVAWETAGALELMSHCHCSRCRKAHGAAFATYVLCQPEAFRLLRGADRIVRYASSAMFARPFCGRCGGVVADGAAAQGMVGVPAGPLDADPGVRPVAHIFVGSKAPWYTIADALPRFDAFPPGYDMPALPALAPPAATGGPRGSCLCGGVAFVVEGEPLRAYHCHCSRCRKARGAAHASNLFTTADGVRLLRGEELLATYRLPGARYFGQVFCRGCGAPMPRVDRDRDLAVVPLGALDDDPGIRPGRHIFAGSRAPWFAIPDDGLPQDDAFPTA
jgi:hypothetical protein